jgi:hypothetical protein
MPQAVAQVLLKFRLLTLKPITTMQWLLVTLCSKWCLLRSFLCSEVNEPLGHQWWPLLALMVASPTSSPRLGLTLIYLLLDGFLHILLLVVLYLALTLVILVSFPELVVVLKIPQSRTEGRTGLFEIYILTWGL